MKVHTNSQRITQAEKDADDHKYYKEHLDNIDTQAFSRGALLSGSEVSEQAKMQVNYDLFNDKLNVADLAYVCKPYGSDVGELPANMVNRDIVSGKIKTIIGIEAKRPFSMACLATNPDATSRKEQEMNKRIADFAIAEIMRPIQEAAEIKFQEQTQGQKLTDQQKAQIQEQIAQETQAQTPPEVAKYMARVHQDPGERLNNQILRWVMQKEKLKDKFSKALKHACISGREVIMIGIKEDGPFARVLNSLYFDYAKTVDSECIEDSQWGVAEFAMSPSELITQFRKELGDDKVEEIYENYREGNLHAVRAENFQFDFSGKEMDSDTIRVIYSAWKSERKVGFLTYQDQDTGQPEVMLVDEDHELDPSMGDISVEFEWIPEVHHGYKICLAEPIYVGMGAFPGQHNDLDTLNVCKLPFIGVDHDDMNSDTTSQVDRLKNIAYLLNVVIYRIELLMASDKGKIFMMNINAVPKSAGIDLRKFQHFLEANKISYFNPNEEGNKKGLADVNAIGKVIDLSLASDINQYLAIAEYLEKKAGDTIGVPKQMEGQISADESVRNVQTTITQSSNILEPTFQLHNAVKRNVLQGLIDLAKVYFTSGKARKVAYFLDDMSQATLDMNEDNIALLSDTTTAVFVADTTNASAAKQAVEQLAHAAMQTQQVDLLDVVKVLRAEGISEAEENLEVGTMRKAEQVSQAQAQQQQAAQKLEETKLNAQKEEWAHEERMIVVKEKERRKTVIAQQSILSMGFNENKDTDGDGELDILEVAKHGVDANIRARQQNLDEKKQADDVRLAEKKLEIDKEKNEIARIAKKTTK